MHGLVRWIVSAFISPIGIIVLGALDSTVFFSFPFGIDAAVIVLSAKLHALAWVVPLLATAGSLAGAWLTFWMGQKIGETGLERFASRRRLQKVQRRGKESGAVALAVVDLMPPPFPFTIFVLAAGALKVDSTTFFATLTVVRLFRFGVEALLAVYYGRGILRWIESDVFHDVVVFVIAVAVVLTIVSMVNLARPSRAAVTSHP